MSKFIRGTVIEHKVMGIGVVLNEVDDKGFVEVRMANGHIDRYYPEELETHEEVVARQIARSVQINNKWRDMW